MSEGGARVLLGKLLDGLPATIHAGPGAQSTRICDLTEDSRTVLPGSLFVARRGEKSDGRAFIPAAVKAGAAAILTDDPALAHSGPCPLVFTADIPLTSALIAERFYGDASSKLALVGITGTNGKTTTTYLLHQLLNRSSLRCGMIGTVCIDDGFEVAPASLTTPPAMELSRTMARMVEAGCRACVMEASSHALHQRRTGALAFQIGIFTNLTHDHLDYHHSMQAYADAKALLFSALPATGTAIVNADDPAAPAMLRACPARALLCRVANLTPPPSAPDSCSATIAALSAAGMNVLFSGPWGTFDILLPLIGPHNAMNALQATAAAFSLGVAADAIKAGLIRASAPPGRLEPVTRPEDPFAVYVDYAHTDDALQRVLEVGRQVLSGAQPAPGESPPRLHVVFGCGGDRDAAKRPKMGAVAARLADRIIITSDNPRTESPGSIITQILSGITAPRATVAVHEDRERAIFEAIKAASTGDLVVIAGKGHEDYQILPDPAKPGATLKRHFDDRQVARAALASRGIVINPPTGRNPLLGTSGPLADRGRTRAASAQHSQRP